MNAVSVLKISSIQRSSAGVFTVTWPSVAGKVYRLLYTDSLVTTFNPLPGAQSINAAGISTSFSDGSAGGLPKRFYRVEVVVVT